MSQVVHVRYSGDPPADAELRRRLGLRGDYTYVVATAAMERRRVALAPDFQCSPQGPQLVFHKMLRHVMQGRLLTRAEERIALQRAAAAVAAQDEELARQLRIDVFAWRDALADLAERDLDLAAGVPPDLEATLVNPAVGHLLRHLQAEYRRRQLEYGRRSYEDAANDFLTTGYRPTGSVVLEGFTFLTPLQQQYVRACLRGGAVVSFVYPYRAEQEHGFGAMRRTYAPYADAGRTPKVELDTPFGATGEDLAHLQRSLFTGSEACASGGHAGGDGSVTLEAFDHRHQEVIACLRRVRAYLDAGVTPDRIAIVTRDPAAFETQLREEAQAAGVGATLGLPPRLLLLTPLGRFVLSLYQVWVPGSGGDGRLELDVERFEAILASGWLGADAQATTDEFAALRAQVFARCRTREQWGVSVEALRRLRRGLEPDSRLPAAAADERTIGLWERALERIEGLCLYLFSAPAQSIGEHVTRLMDALSVLAPEQLRRAEREVLDRIKEALTHLGESASLAMSPGEFGEVLNSLVREYEREADEDADPEQTGRIWVTTPEGIDGYQKDVVLFLGVDNQRVPRQYAESWPFYSPDVDGHQERERYLFLAVVRAGRARLHLSFARADEGGAYRPSPYIEATAAALGKAIEAPPELAPPSTPEPPPAPEPPRPARRRRYTLSEVAHFALCPLRYKLERLDLRARQYKPAFQLRFLAQAHWLDRILTQLEAEQAEAASREDLERLLRDAMGATHGEARAAFPGLRDLDWAPVRNRVEGELAFLAEQAWSPNGHPVRFVPGRESAFVVPDAAGADRAVEVVTLTRHAYRRGRYDYPYDGDLLHEEWLWPGRRPTAGAAPAAGVQVDGVSVLPTQYEAVQWWRRALKAAFFYESSAGQVGAFAAQAETDYRARGAELAAYVEAIEAGRFPKHPGEHCRYCPVRGDCLGLEP